MASLLLGAAVAASAGDFVRDQKLFFHQDGPRAGVFGRRQVVALAPDGKPAKTVTLDDDANEAALSLDGKRLALAFMRAGLVIVDLESGQLRRVEDKDYCANLGWTVDGSLIYTTSAFEPGSKVAAITVVLHRLAPDAAKPTEASRFVTPLPPPPAPPPMPILPGIPPGGVAAPPPGAPGTKVVPAAPDKKKP